MPSRYRAVIFDFFGTLTRAFQRSALHAEVARQLGCDPTAFAHLLNHTYPQRARGGYADVERTLAALAHRQGACPSAAQVRAAAALRLRAIREDIRLRPDAIRTLGALRARGLRTGLVSDCTDELPEIFPTLAVAPLLDATIYSCRLGAVKPHPALYDAVCARLGVAPADCLYLGDGGGRELSGARRAGMTAVQFAAPDLVEHLSFDTEPEWRGPTVTRLIDTLDLVDTRAPYWADERPRARFAPVGPG
ncbi:HAD-IA family hydrolase [Luedemannella helvata]|uniref:HAD family hydrolase n=1 Tax=Luedemannella helvata TaxID=349315 RepID=A0ABP4XCN6_9ACTN